MTILCLFLCDFPEGEGRGQAFACLNVCSMINMMLIFIVKVLVKACCLKLREHFMECSSTLPLLSLFFIYTWSVIMCKLYCFVYSFLFSASAGCETFLVQTLVLFSNHIYVNASCCTELKAYFANTLQAQSYIFVNICTCRSPVFCCIGGERLA